ncbi:MAG: hypothetical protein M9894_22155 [Planctomycetes bacterium]|nr:hypothetical protein [Planctomycetota bacterium]
MALDATSSAFYLADAAGHGAVGAGFWRAFDAAWTTCVAADARLEALRWLGRCLNAHLHAASRTGGPTGLCLAAGRLDPGGLTVAVFG